MNCIIGVLLGSVLLLHALPDSRSPQLTGPCEAVDLETQDHLDWIRVIVRSTNPEAVAWRDRIALPAATDSEVVVVEESATCSRALHAFNAHLPKGVEAVKAVEVIRVGSRYVVSSDAYMAGEFTPTMVFDRAFAYLAVYMR